MALVVAERTRPCQGFHLNGDAIVVRRRSEDTLIALIDGVGHGEPASIAASAAVSVIERSTSNDLAELLSACDDALYGTRGAAVALVQMKHDSSELFHIGVGNVGSYLWSPTGTRTLFNYNGIVGRLTKVPAVMTYETLDRQLLVMHSDGISSRKVLKEMPSWDGQLEAQADRIMEHAVDKDDATLVLAQVRHEV